MGVRIMSLIMVVLTLPPLDYVRNILNYDPATGAFRWLPRPQKYFQNSSEWRRWNTRYAGTPAGHTMPDGYLRIFIDRRGFLGHRLAWLLSHGEPVPPVLDHIDGDTRNNRLSNLRAADYAGNLANAATHRDSTTGIKGVFRIKSTRRFMAYITKNRQRYHIGVYDTLEEAAEARRNAADQMHGKFARH
jgi:hypothetical protein